MGVASRVGVLGLTLAALIGCASNTSEEEATEQAADDYGCDASSISVLDTLTNRSTNEPKYRLFVCGHDVVYACVQKGTHRHRYWECAREGYRFPV